MKLSQAIPFLVLVITGCTKPILQTFPATSPLLHWQGRISNYGDGNQFLWGSAASLQFKFKGDSCKIWLRNAANPGEYNYISFVIDGKHTDRIKINFDSLEALTIVPESKQLFHELELYKETEPKNGAIVIGKIEAVNIEATPHPEKKKIEFIGNSITAGMSSDTKQIPCGQGKWYDQHNAYEAYGPHVSRALNCDFMVVGFSGLGMYRNWFSDYPVMKDVYESVSLSPKSTSDRWNYDLFKSDLIVLCVGSNDLSDGDGHTPRLPFDSTKFIESYISFLKNLHQHQPQAKFLLINGPINSPEKDEIFRSCLNAIKIKAEKEIPDFKPVTLHFFDLIQPNGCDGHPDLTQHAQMAKELEPVIKEMLENKE